MALLSKSKRMNDSRHVPRACDIEWVPKMKTSFKRSFVGRAIPKNCTQNYTRKCQCQDLYNSCLDLFEAMQHHNGVFKNRLPQGRNVWGKVKENKTSNLSFALEQFKMWKLQSQSWFLELLSKGCRRVNYEMERYEENMSNCEWPWIVRYSMGHVDVIIFVDNTTEERYIIAFCVKDCESFFVRCNVYKDFNDRTTCKWLLCIVSYSIMVYCTYLLHIAEIPDFMDYYNINVSQCYEERIIH